MNHGFHTKNGMVKKMEKIKKFCQSKKFIYGVIFLSLLVLSYLFPFSHDDWAWGAELGIERLETRFEGYNGRWIGNFVVLALTRSNLLKTVIMASCLTGIIYLINDIIKSEKKTTILLSYLLILATPYLVFRQGVVWTAGFSNYAASIFFVLLFINLNKKMFEKEKVHISNIWIPCFFLLGFITTLFVEHITLYTVCLSIFAVGYAFFKLKKIYGTQIAYLIGSISGTILMFSNSAYSSVAAGNDGYRSLGLSSFIDSSIKSYFDTIYKELVFNNHILNIVIAILICIILFKILKDKKEKKFIHTLANFILFVVITFVLYSNVTRLMQVNLLLNYTKYFNGLFTIIFCVSILLFVLFFIKKDTVKRRMIFTLVSIVIMTAPLFVVKPIGSRCFFPTYTLFILFVCDLLHYVLYNNKSKEIETYLNKIIVCIAFIFYGYLIAIYGYIFKINTERITYLKENKNEAEIILPKLPYAKYVWYGDPANDVFMERFKLYYGVNPDTEITFVSIKEWKKVK